MTVTDRSPSPRQSSALSLQTHLGHRWAAEPQESHKYCHTVLQRSSFLVSEKLNSGGIDTGLDHGGPRVYLHDYFTYSCAHIGLFRYDIFDLPSCLAVVRSDSCVTTHTESLKEDRWWRSPGRQRQNRPGQVHVTHGGGVISLTPGRSHGLEADRAASSGKCDRMAAPEWRDWLPEPCAASQVRYLLGGCFTGSTDASPWGRVNSLTGCYGR